MDSVATGPQDAEVSGRIGPVGARRSVDDGGRRISTSIWVATGLHFLDQHAAVLETDDTKSPSRSGVSGRLPPAALDRLAHTELKSLVVKQWEEVAELRRLVATLRRHRCASG